MIQIEYLNDGAFVKHYSDAGYLLLQNETGIKYAEPIDVTPCRYTYIETNELIDTDIEDDDVNDEEFIAMLEEVL